MALYICIALHKSDVIEAVPVEAPDDPAALKSAAQIVSRHPRCTHVEMWLRGKKVHTYVAPMRGQQTPTREFDGPGPQH